MRCRIGGGLFVLAALALHVACGGTRPAGTGTAGHTGGGSSGGGIAGAAGTGVACAPTGGGSGGGGFGGSQPTLVDCPATPPAGSCAVENQSCAYATGSCVCDSGCWKCVDCPATRPGNDEQFLISDNRLWMACRYGNVTCSYPQAEGSRGYVQQNWGCGVCPTDHPMNGATCGSARFECRYGNDTCSCNEMGQETWQCASASCSAQLTGSGVGVCVLPGHYTCQFPDFDQSCVCGTVFDTRRCSCPVTPPVDGTPCLAATSGVSVHACTYGAMTCTCNGFWSCPTPICPTNQPASGSPCSSQLNCSYGPSICYCDGTSWSCV